MSSDSDLQKNLQSLQQLQTKLVKDIFKRQTSLKSSQQQMDAKNEAVMFNIQHLKEFYSKFAEECKVEWVGIYYQLLELFNRIVEVYQIKIQRLEDDLEDKNETIKELEQTNSRTKCSDSGITELNRLNQAEDWHFNGKRVKISDFIADSWTKNQPFLNQNVSSQEVDAIEQVEELQTEDRSGKALIDLTEQLNRKNPVQRKLTYKESEELWDGQVSAILSVESSTKLNATDLLKKRKNSSCLSSSSNSMNLRSSIKNATNTDNWQVQRASNTRLDKLRQSFMNKKKNERRII